MRGALLVAPPDLEQVNTPDVLKGFAPVPLQHLSFPSVVIASRDDPYATFASVGRMAHAWGARLEDAGAKGHLNTASNLGEWPFGQAVLQQLLKES